MGSQTGTEAPTDTDVRSAYTGYMKWRLVKASEDLRVHYDHTLRGSAGSVAQIFCGNDALHKILMGGDNVEPVIFKPTRNGVLCSLLNLEGDVISKDALKMFRAKELKLVCRDLWQENVSLVRKRVIVAGWSVLIY